MHLILSSIFILNFHLSLKSVVRNPNSKKSSKSKQKSNTRKEIWSEIRYLVWNPKSTITRNHSWNQEICIEISYTKTDRCGPLGLLSNIKSEPGLSLLEFRWVVVEPSPRLQLEDACDVLYLESSPTPPPAHSASRSEECRDTVQKTQMEV